jgi:hypothetical protein
MIFNKGTTSSKRCLPSATRTATEGFHCKTLFVYTCQRDEMCNVYVDIIDKLRIRKVETLEKILEHDY